MLVLSIALFVLVAALELFFKAIIEGAFPVHAALRAFLMMHEGQEVLWRGALKIALGALSAGTAFLANYYGGLALPQQIFDNRRMELLFGRGATGCMASATDDGPATTDSRLRMLGRESAIESGGWYIAQKENAPGLFI
jgi:hypothetical protein